MQTRRIGFMFGKSGRYPESRVPAIWPGLAHQLARRKSAHAAVDATVRTWFQAVQSLT